MLDAGLTYLMWMEGQYLWLDFQAAEEAGSVTCPVKHSALKTFRLFGATPLKLWFKMAITQPQTG